MRTHRTVIQLLATMLLCVLPAAFAAIGDGPDTILDGLADYDPSATPGGGYVAASNVRFQLDVVDGVAIGVAGEGSLNDANVRFVSDLIGVASGYGDAIAAPIAEFLRTRVSGLAGQGPRVVGVEQFALSLTVTGDAPYHLSFGLQPQQVDPSLFPEARHSVGPADARHVVREFSDFQCPFCQRFAISVLPDLRSELLAEGDVRFEYHHFPLKSIHPNAAAAAEAAECVAAANGPDAFWTMHDSLFAHQAEWQASGDPVDAFVQLAAAADLESDGLESCIRSGRYSDEIEAAFEVATATLGLTGTPTVFVDGLKIGDYSDVDAYQRLMVLSDALRSTTGEDRDASTSP